MAAEKTPELVNSLNVHERASFEKYLESPFFNVGKDAVSLYQTVVAGDAGSRQEYFRTMFPG